MNFSTPDAGEVATAKIVKTSFLLHFSKEMKGFTTTANQDYMELMESLEVQERVLVARKAAQLLCIHDYGNGINKNQ